MRTDKGPEEIQADLLDVHILDVLAQVELLLRNVREIQRTALQLRGVETGGRAASRQQNLADLQRRLGEMQQECRALQDALSSAGEMVREMP